MSISTVFEALACQPDPTSFCHIIFCYDCIVPNHPQPNLNFKWDLSFPEMFTTPIHPTSMVALVMRPHDLYTFPYMKVSIIFSVSFFEILFQDSGNSHNVIEANYTYWRVTILSGVYNDMLYFMLVLKFKVSLDGCIIPFTLELYSPQIVYMYFVLKMKVTHFNLRLVPLR
jgi:hypothetical protein